MEELQAAPAKFRRSSSLTPVPKLLGEISDDQVSRIVLPLKELHRVLGQGLTRGSVVLLAGDPGIGKSTLLLQLLGELGKNLGAPLLYISGEESSRQIKTRSDRLKIQSDRLHVLAETNLHEILSHLENLTPEIVVVDSIQALYWPDLASIPGSISQVREVADRLVRISKQKDITTFIVGHVTKEGSVAGPKALEHLVDTVLQFEGERGKSYRILRACKNRFGPTDEIGVFEMSEKGLWEVENPSELFLRDRPNQTPGTVVFPALEGSRPLLVEIQGLASHSSYGVPMRNAVGFDKNRLTMLLAVLEKRVGLELATQDVFVNVVGGLRISEPAADLAVVCAVMSSLLGKSFPHDAVVYGEVGLAGEIRAGSQEEARMKEAKKLGFSKVLKPFTKLRNSSGLQTSSIRSVSEVLEFLK